MSPIEGANATRTAILGERADRAFLISSRTGSRREARAARHVGIGEHARLVATERFLKALITRRHAKIYLN